MATIGFTRAQRGEIVDLIHGLLDQVIGGMSLPIDRRAGGHSIHESPTLVPVFLIPTLTKTDTGMTNRE